MFITLTSGKLSSPISPELYLVDAPEWHILAVLNRHRRAPVSYFSVWTDYCAAAGSI